MIKFKNKKHEKSMKTPGNSGYKDIFVNLFSGEMVKASFLIILDFYICGFTNFKLSNF